MNVRKQTSKMNVRVIRQGKNLLEVKSNHLFGQRNGRSKISDLQRYQAVLFIKNYIRNAKRTVSAACKLLAKRLPVGARQIANYWKAFKEAANKVVFIWEKAIVGVKKVIKAAAKKPAGADNKVSNNKSLGDKSPAKKVFAGVKKSAVNNLKGKWELVSANKKNST